MVTALTWTSYLDAVARLAVVEPANVDYLALAPQMVNYAELRICRDLDFLNNINAITGFTLTANTGRLTVPIASFVTVENVHVITPVGTSDPNLGTRNQLLPVSREWMLSVYGTRGTTGLPRYFSVLNTTIIMVAPWANANYSVEIVGTTRPASLSATTTTTFISTYLPDLLLMASMIWISGYQRNFGRQSDDPQMAVSYESQYQTLLKSALVEEARKKFHSVGNTSQAPAPLAAAPAA